MLGKFDHKFKDKPYYNFFVTSVGLFFAFYVTVPETWHRPLPLMLAGGLALLTAHALGRRTNKSSKAHLQPHRPNPSSDPAGR